MLAAREIRPQRGHGPRPGPPLVLIHGWAGSSEWWSPLIDRLGGERHVLAVDMMGSNRGPQPPPNFELGYQTEMLERTLAHHGIGEAIVVGQSMGALLAVNLAERAPERVLGLVLLAIPPEMSFLRVTLMGHLSFLPVLGALTWNHGPDFMIRQGLGVLFAPKFSIPDWILREVRAIPHRDARLLRDALIAHLEQVHPRDQIERAAKPTVIVWGEQDQFWPIRAAAEYERVAPVVRLPGVGHTPQVEAPAAVVDEIDRLAASIPAAAPSA